MDTPARPSWLPVLPTPGASTAADAPDAALSPAWKILLYGDGSPTRLLSLLTGAPMAVAVLGREEVFLDLCSPASAASDSLLAAGVPARSLRGLLDGADAGALARRRVWLESARGERLGYAVSWWRGADLDELLPGADAARPIGGAIAATKLDVHRELLSVVRGHNAALELELAGVGAGGARMGDSAVRDGGGGSCGVAAGPRQGAVEDPGQREGGGGGPLWARFYAMHRGGRQLNLIVEVFYPEALVRHVGPLWMA
jgi:chorismate-pyruvate lyase